MKRWWWDDEELEIPVLCQHSCLPQFRNEEQQHFLWRKQQPLSWPASCCEKRRVQLGFFSIFSLFYLNKMHRLTNLKQVVSSYRFSINQFNDILVYLHILPKRSFFKLNLGKSNSLSLPLSSSPLSLRLFKIYLLSYINYKWRKRRNTRTRLMRMLLMLMVQGWVLMVPVFTLPASTSLFVNIPNRARLVTFSLTLHFFSFLPKILELVYVIYHNISFYIMHTYFHINHIFFQKEKRK